VTGSLLAATALVLAAIPALLFLLNLRHYRPPPSPNGTTPAVSVLIPARNEERSLGAALAAVRASRGIDLEVLVLDDSSEDGTARIAAEHAARDGRVRLLRGPPLPTGWCGKQHACAVLARAATHPLLLFVDADVRLAPDGVARLAAFLHASGADLVSGLPRQQTATLLERLVIPLVHFILLGFLPLGRMRRSLHPAYAAGCGQLFLARRDAYQRMGGHAAIRTTLHDGIELPRAFRSAGLRTDLCDATTVATCRMYRGAAELWRGLAKNATEGLARPALIGPFTLLLAGGQVLPAALLVAVPWLAPGTLRLVAAAALLACGPRLLAAWRFRQSWLGMLLHPLGVAVLLVIQWYALLRAAWGRPATWKGRSYASFSLPGQRNRVC
jgi:hypothetical protein